jgi:hypothetical protein
MTPFFADSRFDHATQERTLEAVRSSAWFGTGWPPRSQRRKIYGKPVIVYLTTANFPLKTVG